MDKLKILASREPRLWRVWWLVFPPSVVRIELHHLWITTETRISELVAR
jgi:hypothetical protein